MSMDERLMAIAERQHGVFTQDQAVALGFQRSAIRHRLRCGRWLAAGVGVYRLPGAPRTWHQRLLAVALAAGPNAAASHRSAAALLSIPGFSRDILEVTTPRTRRHRATERAAIVHRWRPFPDHHLTVIDGITTTRVARTLVDLAGVVHPKRIERAVDNCLAAKTASFHELRGTFHELASRGRAGVACMRQILEDRGPLYIPTASDYEREFLEMLEAAGLPVPVRQLDVGDELAWIGRVDFAYPREKIIIEVDSERFHGAKLDREADARRDRRLIAAGWRVVRVTEEDLLRGAPIAIAVLRGLLGLAAA